VRHLLRVHGIPFVNHEPTLMLKYIEGKLGPTRLFIYRRDRHFSNASRPSVSQTIIDSLDSGVYYIILVS
jgi:hypothetical protein